jgi:hypothetical protein
VEFHHIVIRVPDDMIDAWDRHLAAHFPRFSAPEGFLEVIARDADTPGVYHMASVLGEREKVFAAAREAGGGPILLHPLLAEFGAEVVSRERGRVVGLASPKWSYAP